MRLRSVLVFGEFHEILTDIPEFFAHQRFKTPPDAGFRELKGVVQWIDDLAKSNSRDDWLIGGNYSDTPTPINSS